jgi:hypothetical protein
MKNPGNNPDTTTKPRRNYPMLMTFLVWSILTLAIDIAAIVMAFRHQLECGGLASLTPRQFLFVGGFTNIGAFILILYMFFLLFERIRNDVAFIQVAPIGFLVMIIGIFTFAWAITGIIMYTQPGCKHSILGKMILAWSIVKIVGVLGQAATSSGIREDVFVVAYN